MKKNQYLAESWWMECLEIAPSLIQGNGVFTKARIREGTIVIRWGGMLFTAAELASGKAQQHTYVGVADGLYLATPVGKQPTLDDFMNHSCDSNLWMHDEVTLIARKEIAPGEELTADYALWLNKPEYRLKTRCQCRAADCRKKVTGLDWKLPNVQKQYAGHFSPFINHLINNH